MWMRVCVCVFLLENIWKSLSITLSDMGPNWCFSLHIASLYSVNYKNLYVIYLNILCNEFTRPAPRTVYRRTYGCSRRRTVSCLTGASPCTPCSTRSPRPPPSRMNTPTAYTSSSIRGAKVSKNMVKYGCDFYVYYIFVICWFLVP